MSKYERWTEEEAKQSTIKAFIAAVIVTLGMFSVLVYGLAYLSSAEKVSADVYGAKHLQGRITTIEGRVTAMEDEYKEHRHVYSTGKPAERQYLEDINTLEEWVSPARKTKRGTAR